MAGKETLIHLVQRCLVELPLNEPISTSGIYKFSEDIRRNVTSGSIIFRTLSEAKCFSVEHGAPGKGQTQNTFTRVSKPGPQVCEGCKCKIPISKITRSRQQCGILDNLEQPIHSTGLYSRS